MAAWAKDTKDVEHQHEGKPLLTEDFSDIPRFRLSLTALGPALVCCLADGDAGSIMVSAQSGAVFGYNFIIVQFVLAFVLCATLDALVRTAISEKRGFGATVRNCFGFNCAVASLCLLLVSCFGAIVSEMSGISSVATLWGFPAHFAPLLAALFAICIVICLNHRQVELVAMAFGLFELSFVGMLLYFHPSTHEFFQGIFSFHFKKVVFWRVLAANIGAVMMPWMIYFFQSAVVAKRITTAQGYAQERTECLFGSALTQFIMISVMIVLAASPNVESLEDITDIHEAIKPLLGPLWAKVLLSFALTGGSMCALFTASLAASWAICDTLGQDPEDCFSLDKKLHEAPRFYGCFACIVLIGAVVLFVSPDVIKLNVYIELLNALMIPLALFFLCTYVTGAKVNRQLRVTGFHKILLYFIFGCTSLISITSAITGLISPKLAALKRSEQSF